MHTYESLKKDIISLGIKKDDFIHIHSSLKSVGDIEGRGDTLLDVFMDYLGEEGMLSLPTHTGGSGSVVDLNMTPSYLGVLPNLFRVRNGVARSAHASHCISAFGKRSEEFTQGDEKCASPCPAEGCYSKLLDWDAKILLIGVTLTCNTFFHFIEETSVEGKAPWLTEGCPVKIIKQNGEIVDSWRCGSTINTSQYFDRVLDDVLALESTVTGKIGDADCILMSCKDVYPIVMDKLKENPNIFK